MKTIYNKLLVGLLMVALSFTMANSPLNAQKVAKGINYQAVLRDSENKFIADKNIKVTISIFKKEINGELVWEETHNPTTNKVGIFTLVIGQGTRIKGYVSKFSDIRWGTEEHLLKVVAEVDGRTIDFPASPMLSVPYAFFADSARVARADFSGVAFDPISNTLKNSNAVIADLSPLRQSLEYDPASYHLSISGKPGIVDLRQFAHSPQDLRILNNKLWITGNKDSTVVDLSPYKQTLQVSSTSKLQISGGNEVQVDTSNVNEIQTLSLNGNKVGLSKSGGEVTIDPSETNELQTLSKVNGALVLSNAPNGRAIPVDTSNVNELQDILLTGDKLSLSKTTGNVTIDANSTNELITSSSFDGDKIHIIEAGNDNQIDVSALKNVSWVGFNCQKNTEVTIPKQSATPGTYDIQWDQVDNLSSASSFESSTKFIVPSSGIYQLSFNLIFDKPITVQIIRGASEVMREYLAYFGNSLSTLLLVNLNAGDRISIRLINYSTFDDCKIRKGDFASYRIH